MCVKNYIKSNKLQKYVYKPTKRKTIYIAACIGYSMCVNKKRK